MARKHAFLALAALWLPIAAYAEAAAAPFSWLEWARNLIPLMILPLVELIGRLWARYKGSVPDWALLLLPVALGPVLDSLIAQLQGAADPSTWQGVLFGGFATFLFKLGQTLSRTLDGKQATPRKTYA